MCVDLSCVHSQGGSSSSGVGKGAGVTIAVAVLAALTYNVLVVAWPIFLALEIAGLCIAYRKSWVARGLWSVTKLTVAGVIWVVRWYLKRRQKPSTEVVVPQEYQATLYVEGKPGQANKIITRGVVPGLWTSADEVRREVKRLYVEKYGEPTHGKLECHAQPVTYAGAH